MTGVRIFAAMLACALMAAAATPSLALPKPRYPVDGGESASKSKHAKKPDLAGGPKDARSKTYTVAHGDTLLGLAHRFRVTRKELADANDLHGTLRPGMKLHIPRGSSKDETRQQDREEADAAPHSRKGAKAEVAHVSTYTVAHGDTVSSIARRLGVTTRELADANDLHGKLLRSGMRLKVPSAAETREVASDEKPMHGKHADAAPSTYTVAHGDTLSGIAKKLHVSTRALADANDLHHKPLRPGMKLKVPGAEAAPAEVAQSSNSTQTAPGGGLYTVARGDTLTGVARRFHITARQLRAANDLAPDEPLDHGMKLKVPTGAHDHGRDAHASGVLVSPKLRVAVVKPTAKPVTPKPATDATDTPDEGYMPTQVADNSSTRPVPAPPPAETRPNVQVAMHHSPPRVSGPPIPAPKPTLQSGVMSGDTEGPPPAPGSPSFRAANDQARVSSIHPPVTHGYPSSSELASLGHGKFIWPVKGEVLTHFGDMGHGLGNDGMNIVAEVGTSVRSAADGQVVYAGSSVPGLGNMILVKHADGWVTAYGHLSRIDVKIGQRVLQGDQIGEVGDSGGIDRPQLHFEVRYAPPSSREKARPVDPGMLLP
ncbi:MAG TPA: LysM peptidoglycan-binding domain-containing protein [Caulobacteraceae bacterium]|jgi:murein DD-endopeptidase MepM/ murein hydrolase activator NlpD|nr:LysM peptidoglycan-binding domain-containing protein [Caulobacteraceae bacterium]